MTKLFGLKTSCPNCKQHFWFFKNHKGIDFCPKCLQSLYVPQSGQTTIVLLNVIVGYGVIFCLALLLQEGYMKYLEAQGILGETFLDIIDNLLLLLFLVFVVFSIRAILLSNLIVFKNSLMVGVDKFSDTTADKGDYVNSEWYRSSAVQHPQYCSHCKSQRMQFWLDFKSSHQHLQQPISFDIDKITNDKSIVVGCLHCAHIYQTSYVPNKWFYNESILILILIFILIIATEFKVVEWLITKLLVDVSPPQTYYLVSGVVTLVYIIVSLINNYNTSRFYKSTQLIGK